MEFRLDEAQVELQGTVAKFCSERFPDDSIAAREGVPLDRSAWRDLAALGVMSLLLDEERGGAGLGPVECALVFEQLGWHLVSGPILWSVLAASLIDGAAQGEIVVGGVDGRVVDEGVAIVESGADVDAVLVLRDTEIELYRSADFAEPTRLDPLDPLTPVARIEGLLPGRGELLAEGPVAQDLRDLGTVLVASSLSGIAERSLDVARSYALERHQFDAPIGSFQAIKHMLADMFVRSGLAQSACYAAAAVIQEPGTDDPGSAASAAKVVAADAANANASAAVQVLGGMGFTWDMLPNYLLKRTWLLEHTFGTGESHAGRIGASLVAAHR